VGSPSVLGFVVRAVVITVDLNSGQLKSSVEGVLSEDDGASSDWLAALDGVPLSSRGSVWKLSAVVASDVDGDVSESVTAAVSSVQDLDLLDEHVASLEVGKPPVTSSHSGVGECVDVGVNGLIG
jgi:hypothetical protein